MARGKVNVPLIHLINQLHKRAGARKRTHSTQIGLSKEGSNGSFEENLAAFVKELNE